MSESTSSSPHSPLLQGHDPHRLAAMVLAVEAPSETADAEKPWTTFGGLELFEEIGRGGMGVVYRARQTALDRIVAVKVLLRAQFATAEERERFHREAQAAARLQHAGIVGIFDVGEDEGVPWFSMEHIAGQSLEQAVREHPMEAKEAARCVQTVATALQHAHDNGVLHRDLKPSNILLDADEAPRITDFGIARLLSGRTTTSRRAAAELTRTGQSLGSPGYAAPEQVLHGLADVRTDVYGLGALLYHLLTGRPPFQGPTLDAILVQLRENDPLSPRRLNPTVPRDLETVCLKCLRKQPENRYATAAAVADEMERFLGGKPILARPAGALERTWRWTRRHPGMAALLGVIVLLLAGILLGLLAFARHQARLEHRAALLSEARSLRLGRLAGSREQALAKLRQAAAIRPAQGIRDEIAACLSLPDIGPARILTSVLPPERPALHMSGIAPGSLVALDDDGKRAAVVAPGSGDLRILSLAEGAELTVCRHPQRVSSLDWSDGLIAAGCDNRFIYIWSDDGALKHRLTGHEAVGIQVAFRPGTQQLATTSSDVHLRLWHAALGEEIVHRDQAHEPHTALWWSEDGMRLFGAHAGGTADLYDLSDERCFQVLAPPQEEPHSENLGSASFSPDGRLAAVSDENCLRVWDIKHARLVHRFAKGEQEWMSALFDRSGKTLWIAGFNSPPSAHEILLGDGGRVSLGAPRKLTDTSGSLLRAASADGRHLVLSNNGLGRFFVLEIATGKLVGLRHPGVLATAVAHDSSWVATSSYQTPGVRIWSLPEGKEERTIAQEGVARQLALTPDGATLYINLGHGLRAFRAGDWIERPLPELPALHGLTLAPDGRLLIVGEDHVRFLDTATWQETQRLHLPPQVGWLGDAHALFDQAGRHLMVHTALGTVVRWDLGCLEAELRALACAAGVPGKSISWLHANDWGRGAAFSCSSPPPRPASWIVWPCW